MKLLEMSISAGVLILLLAILRKSRCWHLTKRTVMLLWMIVLARLLLPGSLPIQNGIAAPLLQLLQRVSDSHKSTTDAGMHGIAAWVVPKAASFGTIGYESGLSLLQTAACGIWLAGMAGIGIYFVHCLFREYRMLAEALVLDTVPEAYGTARRLAGIHTQKKPIPILVHDRIRSPLVYGILRQKIVIPKNLLQLDQVQLQCILTHELVHIKRHDNLWKLLSAAAVCIHWFNPAVWLMYILFARDLELSCDEQVLSVHGSKGRQEYAMTLLTLAQYQNGTTLFCSGFLENPVKERIVAIMKYKKLTGIGVLCAVMLVAGASSVFATNGQADKPDAADYVDYSIVSTTDGADTPLKNSSVKASVKKEDKDSILLEIHSDAEEDDPETVTVRFSEPLLINSKQDWEDYDFYTDEDGVVYIQNGEEDEALVNSQATLPETDPNADVDAADYLSVNSSSDEIMDADAPEIDARIMQDADMQNVSISEKVSDADETDSPRAKTNVNASAKTSR